MFNVDPFDGAKETFMKVVQAVIDVFDNLKNGVSNIVRKIPGAGWIMDKLGVGGKPTEPADVNAKKGTSRRRESNLIKQPPRRLGMDYSFGKPGGNRARGSSNSNSQTNNNVSNSVSYNIQGRTDLASSALNFATT